MKWKYNDFDQTPELSSDIEWMIQSGQASYQLIMETLATTYFIPIYRLAVSMLNDERAAKSVVRDVFSRLMLDLHTYRSQMGVETWIYKLAYATCQRALRKEKFWRRFEKLIASPGQFTDPIPIGSASVIDREIWQQIDHLDEVLWLPMILRFGNGWSTTLISNVVGMSESAVEERISTALQSVLNGLQYSPDAAPTKIEESLAGRWRAQIESAPEPDEFIKRMHGQTGRRVALRGSMATLRELVFLGLAILFVILILWGGNLFLHIDTGLFPSVSEEAGFNPNGDHQSNSARSTPTATPHPTVDLRKSNQSRPHQPTPTPSGVFYIVKEGDELASVANRLGTSIRELSDFNRLPDNKPIQPGQILVIPGSLPTSVPLRATPVSTVAHADHIDRPVTSDDVFNLLNPEEFPFNTLWFTADVFTNQTGNLETSQNVSQIQVWISPRQFLLIGGKKGGGPQEIGIGTGGRLYVARPGNGQPWFERANTPYGDPFVDKSLLQGLYLLFGDIEEFSSSSFKILGESRIAGRDTWVISQVNSQNMQSGLLWLDESTGLILRHRRINEPEYHTGYYNSASSEVIIRVLAYDVDFPQELFNRSLPWRGGYAANYTGEPGDLELNQENNLGYFYPEAGYDAPLPDGYDLSHSHLSFRYPIGSYRMGTQSGTDIFADDYFLGLINMGVPWYASCQRSPDGYTIVYQSSAGNKDDFTSISGGPFILNLTKPLEIRSALPNAYQVSKDFSISPDSQSVALWGCERTNDSCGVYIHDLINHDWRKIVDVDGGAQDFVWNPDSDQLAFITASNAIEVVRVEDGEVVYTGDYDPISQRLPLDAPIEGWNVNFPQPTIGLASCIDVP